MRKFLTLLLLGAASLAAQISITAPIPGYGAKSIQITVTTPTLRCQYTVVDTANLPAPGFYRTCYYNNHQMVSDTLDYSVPSSTNYFNFFAGSELINIRIARDLSGRATYQVLGSAGSAGPNQFPGQ